MPTTADRSRELAAKPAELSADFFRASLDASRNWTTAYLEGLERAVDFQRQLIESFATAGERYASVAASLAERANRAGSEVAEAVTKSVDEAAKARNQLVAGLTEEPLPGYDKLTAEELVAKLPTLTQQTLALVGWYEQTNQARETVLARVESLTGAEPVPGYDERTVAEIKQLLADGDEELAKQVRDYERAHSARSGVLQAARARLERS